MLRPPTEKAFSVLGFPVVPRALRPPPKPEPILYPCRTPVVPLTCTSLHLHLHLHTRNLNSTSPTFSTAHFFYLPPSYEAAVQALNGCEFVFDPALGSDQVEAMLVAQPAGTAAPLDGDEVSVTRRAPTPLFGEACPIHLCL